MKKSANKWIAFDFGSSVPSKETLSRTLGRTSSNQISNRGVSSKICSFNLIEQLKPKTKEDLAVHSKKIKEVELWLEQNVVCSKDRITSVLLLTGPTGSGKTATINVLCESMGLQLVEWVNPLDYDYDLSFAQAQASRFIEFFMQSKYASLCENANSKRVVLVEDFPNFIVHNPSDFPGVLEKCLSGGSPVIFICTDVSSGKLDLSQKLFPQEVKEKFNIATISFNPCTTTLLKNVLKRAQTFIEAQKDLYCNPSADIIEAITSSTMGDIRCAINQYHFASLKGMDTQIAITTTINSIRGTKRKRSETTSLKSMAKDEKLGFFHGLGRVLNPKRINTNNTWRIQCDFDSLIEEFSIQPTTFNSFLQENYLNYFGDMSDVQKAAEILSQAQIFLDKWDDRHDTLLYALWIAVLGLMVYNEHKVSKWNQIKAPTKIKSRANKALNEGSTNKTDGIYYNIITKNDAFHTFKI